MVIKPMNETKSSCCLLAYDGYTNESEFSTKWVTMLVMIVML